MTLQMRLALTVALLSAWLGAALVVAFSVAPVAMDLMPPPQHAGDLVGPVLAVVFVSGMLISVFIAGLTVAGARWRYALAAVMTAVCAAAHFVIDPRIDSMRDNRASEFGTLHALSVGMLGLAMLAALILVILSLRDLQRSSESANG